MTKQDLEKVVKDPKPTVSGALHRFLGVSIDELNKDISEKLKRNPLTDFAIDITLPFKEAKKKFRKTYLRTLLRISHGNISEVAKLAGVDRRSIHRIVQEAGIDVSRIRDDMIRPYEIKQKAIGSVIETVLDNYKSIIHPEKLKEVYANMPEVSKDILEEIDMDAPSLKDAEEMFEKEYLREVLDNEYDSLKTISDSIGLRYETLLRKIKKYKLSKNKVI